MKAQISEVLQAVFAVSISIILFVLLVPNIGQPAWQTYGKSQADMIAQSIAMSIDALGISDAGEIKKTFDGLWVVEIFVKKDSNWIRVKHGDVSSNEVKIFTPIKDLSADNPIQLKDVKTITFTKITGGLVEVSSA